MKDAEEKEERPKYSSLLFFMYEERERSSAEFQTVSQLNSLETDLFLF